jgi:serine phosphatase RsbU (regulator of sigma subunit)
MTSSEARARELFEERLLANYRRTDRLFAYLMVAQWIFAIALALWMSPYSWTGKARSIHLHVQLAIFMGGALSSVPIALALLRPGWVGTRYTIAVAQMMWSALLVHLTGGRIETHFHVFGSLAFLAFYRDVRVLVPATVVVVADHLIRQLMWPESVFGISNPETWRFLEHAGWVVFEDIFLAIACFTSVREMKAIAQQNARIEETERAAKEMELAAEIQTSILPAAASVAGLEASMQMHATESVGGDYYDVIPVPGGCWIAVGDVAGHGLRAGLTMLQVQAALAALVRQAPDESPGVIWSALNRSFFENVRTRLRHDEHMTLSLLRFYADGRFVIAGAHEEIVIWRAATSRTEVVPLAGTWLGLDRDSYSEEQTIRLEIGDVMVLYTDGIIEARDGNGRLLGIDAVRASIAERHADTVDDIRDAIFALTTSHRVDDDASVLVFRYSGMPAVTTITRPPSHASA